MPQYAAVGDSEEENCKSEEYFEDFVVLELVSGIENDGEDNESDDQEKNIEDSVDEEIDVEPDHLRVKAWIEYIEW